MRLIVGLVMAAVMAVPWIAPASVQAGFGNLGCPINYGPTRYDDRETVFGFLPTLENSPLAKSASKRDKNDDGIVCQKFGGPGPQFVDNVDQEQKPPE